jgi:hypothetical protein
MSILTDDVYRTELEAVTFYKILADQGFPDIFTCPVGNVEWQAWSFEDEPVFSMPINKMISWLTPTSTMAALEVQRER